MMREEVSAAGREVLRNQWIEHSKELDRLGRFAKYSRKQREEVLRKGFLGQWPPDKAIAIAGQEAQKGTAVRTPKFNNEMRDCFGLVGEEVRGALLKILGEVPAASYEPPADLEEPPGIPFVFWCNTLEAQVYFKFQIEGTSRKPRVLFWSCHPPLYR